MSSPQRPAPLVTAGRAIRLLRPYVLHLKSFEQAIGSEVRPERLSVSPLDPQFSISQKRPKRTYKSTFHDDDPSQGEQPESSRAALLRQARDEKVPVAIDAYRPSPTVSKAIRSVQRSFENLVEATYGKRKALSCRSEVGPHSLQAICTGFVGGHLEQSVDTEWALHIELLDREEGRADDDAPGYTIAEAEDWRHERTRELYEELPSSLLRHAVLAHAAALVNKCSAHPARNFLIDGIMNVCLRYEAYKPYKLLAAAFLSNPSSTLGTCLRAFETASQADSHVATFALGRALRPTEISDPVVRQHIFSLVHPTLLLHHLSESLASGEDAIAGELLGEIMTKHTIPNGDYLKQDVELRRNLSRLLLTTRRIVQKPPVSACRPVASLTAFHLCLLAQLGLLDIRQAERGLLSHLRMLKEDPGFRFDAYHPVSLRAIYDKIAQYGQSRPPRVLAWLLNFALRDERVDAGSKAWVETRLRVEEACIVESETRQAKFTRTDSGRWKWDDTIDQWVAESTQRPSIEKVVSPPRVKVLPDSQRSFHAYRPVIERRTPQGSGLPIVIFERDTGNKANPRILRRPKSSSATPKTPACLKPIARCPSSADPMECNYNPSPMQLASSPTAGIISKRCLSPLVEVSHRRPPYSPMPSKRRRKSLAR